jgi:hypothetical protein
LTLPFDDGIVVVRVEKGRPTMPGGRVPGALRNRLGDDATFGLIEVLDAERKDWSQQVLSVAADRFECRLTEEISSLRLELRQAMQEGLASVRQELATTRVEMLKWSFLFWVGQVAAMAGLLALMFKFTGR